QFTLNQPLCPAGTNGATLAFAGLTTAYRPRVCRAEDWRRGGEKAEFAMRSGVLHARPTSARLRRRWPARPSSRAESAPATRLFFVRHASHDLLDHVLVGRGPDVPLSAAGIEEAYQVAAKLAKRGITRVHTSPRQRAVETANMIARTAKVPLQIAF